MYDYVLACSPDILEALTVMSQEKNTRHACNLNLRVGKQHELSFERIKIAFAGIKSKKGYDLISS